MVGFDRVQSGEYLRLDDLESGQRNRRRAVGKGNGIPHLGGLQLLDTGDDETHLSCNQALARLRLGREYADLLAQMPGAGGHEQNPVFRAQCPVHHAHQHDHADVIVEPGIDNECLERRLGIALGWRNPRDDGLQNFLHALTGLGADAQRVLGVDADHVFNLVYRSLRIGRRQVDFVQHRHHFHALLDRGIAVGHGLRFHAL